MSLEFTANAEALPFINEFITQVLRYGNHWNVILKALAIDPTNSLIHVLVADYLIARGQIPAAVQHISKAKDHVSRANPREKLYVEAHDSWLSGHSEKALELFQRIIAEYPTDIFATKRAQLVAFCMGDEKKFLSVGESFHHSCSEQKAAGPSQEYIHGMISFALEQNGRHKDAEEQGRRGDSHLPSDPWAHHGVAHALYAQRRWADGIEWMTARTEHWKDCMSFMYTHNHFHLALFYLGNGDIQSILKLFDAKIWPSPSVRKESQEKIAAWQGFKASADAVLSDPGDGPGFLLHDPCYPEDQLGALDLLWKLELHHGTDAGLDSRWKDVLSFVTVPTPHVNPLFDLLVLHGLGRIKSEKVDVQLKSMEDHLAKISDPAPRDAWQRVTLPLARGIACIGNSQFDQAYNHLSPVMEREVKCDEGTGQTHAAPCSCPGIANKSNGCACGQNSGSTEAKTSSLPPISVIGGSSEQREVVHECYLRLVVQLNKKEQAAKYRDTADLPIRMHWS